MSSFWWSQQENKSYCQLESLIQKSEVRGQSHELIRIMQEKVIKWEQSACRHFSQKARQKNLSRPNPKYHTQSHLLLERRKTSLCAYIIRHAVCLFLQNHQYLQLSYAWWANYCTTRSIHTVVRKTKITIIIAENHTVSWTSSVTLWWLWTVFDVHSSALTQTIEKAKMICWNVNFLK